MTVEINNITQIVLFQSGNFQQIYNCFSTNMWFISLYTVVLFPFQDNEFVEANREIIYNMVCGLIENKKLAFHFCSFRLLLAPKDFALF